MYANIPAPLPDEFLRSYGFRIGFMNSTRIAQQDKLLSRLVEITGLSISHFIYHHTSLGYQRFVSGDFFHKDIAPPVTSSLTQFGKVGLFSFCLQLKNCAKVTASVHLFDAMKKENSDIHHQSMND